MKLPRLLATDLDGTLLREDLSISERTATALRRAREAGMTIMAVTARPPRALDELQQLAPLLNMAVCSNGALLYDPASRRCSAERAISVPTVRATAAALRGAIDGISFGVETGFEVVAERAYTAPTESATAAPSSPTWSRYLRGPNGS